MIVSSDIFIKIEVRNKNGTKTQSMPLPGENLMVQDIYVELSKSGFAPELFKDIQNNQVEIIPGYLVVLDDRMIHAWEVQDTPVSDGQTLKFVQVVPGG